MVVAFKYNDFAVGLQTKSSILVTDCIDSRSFNWALIWLKIWICCTKFERSKNWTNRMTHKFALFLFKSLYVPTLTNCPRIFALLCEYKVHIERDFVSLSIRATLFYTLHKKKVEKKEKQFYNLPSFQIKYWDLKSYNVAPFFHILRWKFFKIYFYKRFNEPKKILYLPTVNARKSSGNVFKY